MIVQTVVSVEVTPYARQLSSGELLAVPLSGGSARLHAATRCLLSLVFMADLCRVACHLKTATCILGSLHRPSQELALLYTPVHNFGRLELDGVSGQLMSKHAQELVDTVLSTMRQLLLKLQQASMMGRRAVICCICCCILLSAHAATGEQSYGTTVGRQKPCSSPVWQFCLAASLT